MISKHYEDCWERMDKFVQELEISNFKKETRNRLWQENRQFHHSIHHCMWQRNHNGLPRKPALENKLATATINAIPGTLDVATNLIGNVNNQR
jgi:hypothetical protein